MSAWSVDDLASLEFAEVLYGSLLGMKEEEGDNGTAEKGATLPKTFAPAFMHAAMRDARRAVFKMANGARSWGAYQHYGNPYLRLFSPRALNGTEATKPEKRKEPRK